MTDDQMNITCVEGINRRDIRLRYFRMMERAICASLSWFVENLCTDELYSI